MSQSDHVDVAVLRRAELDEVIDDEAVGAEQPDPLAVRDLEVDGAVAEREAAHAEVGTLEPAGLPVALLVVGEVEERGAVREREPPARAQ